MFEKRVVRGLRGLGGSVIALILGAQSWEARALPRINQPQSAMSRVQAERFASDPKLSGSMLLGDSDDPSVLYVSPATKKSQSGVFAITGGEPQCGILEQMFHITFYVPEKDYTKVALAGPFSPYFDWAFGNRTHMNKILITMGESIKKLSEIQNAHQAEYGAYVAATASHDRSLQELTAAQQKVDEINLAVTNAISLLATAHDAATLAAARAAVDAAVANRDRLLPDATRRLVDARNEELAARRVLSVAEADWKPYGDQTKLLQEDINAVKSVYDLVQTNSDSAYHISLETLNAFDSKPVGVASASYHLWDDEVSEARSILSGSILSELGLSQAPTVVQLPMLEVSLAMPTLTATTQSVPIAPNLPGETKVAEVHESQEILTSTSSHSEMSDTGLKTASGAPVLLKKAAYKNQGAGTFNAIVSQGAYCTGSSDLQPLVTTFTDPSDPKAKLPGYKYKSRPANVMAQSVALNYQYPTKSAPVAVNCSLDLQSFGNYMHSSGSKSFLFWSRSWDDTVREEVRKNGVSCEVHDTPTWVAPEDQQAYLQEIKEAQEREIMAEYLLNYAKSWTTTKADAPVPMTNAKHAFQDIGNAMMMVCGGNPYCLISSVVLKSADELFGQHAGETSTRDSFTGKISRNFLLDTWAPAIGSATIDLTVSAQ